MKHQRIPDVIKTCNAPFEELVANLITECHGIIRERLEGALPAVSAAVLAEQLWRGVIEPGKIHLAMLYPDQLQALLADLSARLSSLTAGVFERPVMLRLAGPLPGIKPGAHARLLEEQLAWSRGTQILNTVLMESCRLVWKQAVSDCAWPVRRLQPGKMLWRMLGTTPREEEKRCLQELTRAVDGVRVNMQKRLFKTIAVQVAAQVWSLYDGLSADQASGMFMRPGTDHCA